MKENSREDIKNIEEIIELSKEEIEAKDENITAILDIEDLISLEHLLSDYKRLQEEFKQVEHKCERLEEREEILNKYKLALFMVIRNSMVMPQGIKLGKTDKEINEMSYETMCSVLTMIDYDRAEKFYKEGKGEKK